MCEPSRGPRCRSLATVLLAACIAGGCRRQQAPQEPEAEQVLRIGSGSEANDLDPAVQASIGEYVLETALYEGLVDIANDGLTKLPGVAESWEASADGLTYTFHIRKDAEWSDGSPLTAGDFVYSFNRVFLPALASPNSVEGYVIVGAEDIADGKAAKLGVEAPDPLTFVIHLKHRAPYILDYISGAPFVPVQRAAVERFGGGTQRNTPWTRPGNLVSNGPFMLSAWHPNQDIVLTHNPHYWDAKRTRLREIRFYPTDDTNVEEHMFRSGQLDVTYALPNSKIAVYAQQDHTPLHVSPLLGTIFISLNVAVPPLNDVRVRRALSLALDRERLVPAALHGAGTPAHSLTRPGTGGYTPPGIVDHDADEARRLLAEAGYPNGAGFPNLVLRFSSSHASSMSEVVQEAWRKELGIQVTLESQELKTFLGGLHEKNYQIALNGYSYLINAPETMLLVPLSDSNWNFTGWGSADYDGTYHQAQDATDDAGRRAAFDRMEHILATEAPLIPLFFINQPFLVSPRVRGWRDNNLSQIDWRELSIAP